MTQISKTRDYQQHGNVFITSYMYVPSVKALSGLQSILGWEKKENKETN